MKKADAALGIRIPIEERDAMTEAAKRDGMTVSAWIRHLATKRIEEQESGVGLQDASAAFALTNALRAFLDEELDRRIKAAK